jgi:hypothetical protein
MSDEDKPLPPITQKAWAEAMEQTKLAEAAEKKRAEALAKQGEQTEKPGSQGQKPAR